MAVAPISWPNPMRAIGAQNLLTMPGGVTMSGYLHKKGGSQFSLMKWPLRYIIIHKGCVYYFKTSTSASPQGAFSLNGYNRVMRAAEETTSSNVFPFKIVHYSKRHRTWYFSAASEDERRKWMRHLRKEIDHYNDKDVLDHSESDSDAESFYGAIERPLDITDSTDDPNAEYIAHDEDGYDEDYLIPDEPSGRPKVPPSYPPPPVPSQDREVFIPSHPKGPPPPPPNKIPPHPQLHLSPSNHVPLPIQKPPLRMSAAPSISPGSQKKLAASSPSLATLPGYNRKPASTISINIPSTLPICQGLEKKVVLNPADRQYSGNTSSGDRKPNFSTPLGHKPPPPTVPKPPVPATKPKLSTISIQRSSPDGQSFRSSVEENPLKKRNKAKDNEEGSDDDNDYENIQLPDSVFVNTTETSFVEKLFKETSSSPQDGLYCIRNSGTKTSKVLVVWDVSLNKARNYRIFEGDSIYLEADLPFLSLAELVEFYHSNPLPNHGSLCLQQPYGYTPPR